MVREVCAVSPFSSARFGEQPTSRTTRLRLSRAFADPSQAIRLKLFYPLLLRQKSATGRTGRKRRCRLVQMVRELSPCAFDAYAVIFGSNGCSLLTRKRSWIARCPVTLHPHTRISWISLNSGSSGKCAFQRVSRSGFLA